MKSTVAYDHEANRADAAQAVEGYSAERIAAIAREQARAYRPDDLRHRPAAIGHHPGRADPDQPQRRQRWRGKPAGCCCSREMVGGSSYSRARPAMSKRTARRRRRSSGTICSTSSFPRRGRIVDKTLNTSRYLGLAAALLPEAPLIWITRDPLDRAWSCLRTNFLRKRRAVELRSPGHRRAFSDWRTSCWPSGGAILGDRLLVISYEALVTDPAAWIGRILTHCGLAEEPPGVRAA